MRNRAYRTVPVKRVAACEVLSQLPAGPVWIGVDVGKTTVTTVVRDSRGDCGRPWKTQNPSELRLLTNLLKELASRREIVVAMESTGTYGDALRQCLNEAGLGVHRVSGKAVSDYAEVFDGVPSAHDGKDAAVIAELAAIGKSQPWLQPNALQVEAEMKAEVAWLDAQQRIFTTWLGRIEALLARHWPELTRLLELSRPTLLRMLARYGGPARLADDEQAAALLKRWGGARLRDEKIAAILHAARETTGMPIDEPTAALLRRCAQQALAALLEQRRSQRKLRAMARDDKNLEAEMRVVGPVTACVLRASVGRPSDYHCGQAYRKAIGLNLKERSSGKHQGLLKITKRGPSIARRWLYFAALRAVQSQPVKTWYEAKRRKDNQRGSKAVVAVMGKLALALHAVSTRGEEFSIERLLPGRPLKRSSRSAGKPHGGAARSAED